MADESGDLTLLGTARRLMGDLRRYRDYVLYTARAELRSEIANAYLDWIWWVLEPFCLMIVYTIVFGIIFKSKEPCFPVFVMTGIAMWRFFAMSVQGSATLVRSRKMIVSRIYVPKHMLLLVHMLRCGFKSLFSFGVVAVMMAFYGIRPSWTMLMVIPAFVLLFLVTYCVCCLVMHVGVFVDDTSYMVNVALTMLMYFTGTFWSIETRIPAPWGLLVSRLNPVAFSISLARNGLLYAQNSFHWSYCVWIVVLVVLSLVGSRLVYRSENTYAKVI